MKKYLKTLYQALKSACTTFTFIMFAVYLIASIFGDNKFGLNIHTVPTVFLISLWFAISNLLFHVKKLDIIVRTLLHFLAYTIGFYVVMHFIIEHNESASSAFVFTVVFVILYAIIAVSVFLIAHLLNRKKNEEEDYTPAFDKKKTDDKKDDNSKK